MDVADLTRSKSSAPGQYLGYALQPVRLCFHLMSAPAEALVSLEHLDDVAVHGLNGSHFLEQCKSALSGNPAADRSVEFWKALANWAELCASGKVKASTSTFRYYVTPSAAGVLAAKLHNAKDENAATEAFKQIDTKKFLGKPGVGANPYIAKFLSAGAPICIEIIRNFELLIETDPLAGIRSKLMAVLPENVIEDFMVAAIGNAKEQVDQLIRDGKPPLIKAASFRKWFQAFVRRNNLANLLQPTTAAPSDEEIQNILSGTPLFVRQLEAVKATQDLMITAVSDYLRTTADKINWAAEGKIVEESLDTLDEELQRHHKIAADEVGDTLGDKPLEFRGRAVYRKCIGLQIPLEGQSLPLHFIGGAFNCLANAHKVGWHPDHDLLFKDG